MSDPRASESGPLDELVTKLASASAFDAGGAEAALRAHAEPARVATTLVQKLQDARWPESARVRAVRLLGELPDASAGDEALHTLMGAARSSVKVVRAAASLALGRRLETALHARQSIEKGLLAALALNHLYKLLHDPARDVRAAACSALVRAKPWPDAIPEVAIALREVAARTTAERPDLDARALAPWIRQEQRDLLAALDPFVDDPELPAALRPLVPLLLEIARDPAAEDPDVRLDAASRAAALVGRSGERAAVPGLAAILDDGVARNGEVLDSVAFALGELGGPEAEAALMRELARPRLRSFEAAGYPETVRAALLRARRTQ